MFKTIESFRSQIDRAIEKVNTAEAKRVLAENKVAEATLEVSKKADVIRGEADALIIRANQINQMLDAILPPDSNI